MKRTAIIIVAALALGAAVTACGGRQQATRMKGGTVFDISPEILASRADTLVDIGVVHAGEIIRYDAWLRNAGTVPLVITSVNTSCGCTSVEYEKQPVAPNGKGGFSFLFDSRGMWGMQMKLIEIHTSASSAPYKIRVRAEVEDNEFFN